MQIGFKGSPGRLLFRSTISFSISALTHWIFRHVESKKKQQQKTNSIPTLKHKTSFKMFVLFKGIPAVSGPVQIQRLVSASLQRSSGQRSPGGGSSGSQTVSELSAHSHCSRFSVSTCEVLLMCTYNGIIILRGFSWTCWMIVLFKRIQSHEVETKAVTSAMLFVTVLPPSQSGERPERSASYVSG